MRMRCIVGLCKIARKIVTDKFVYNFAKPQYYKRSDLFSKPSNKLLVTMPPKRKQQTETPKEDETKTKSTKSTKDTKSKKVVKQVEEPPTRPKRNKTLLTTYNEDYYIGEKPKRGKTTASKSTGKAIVPKKSTKSASKIEEQDVQVKVTKGRKKTTDIPVVEEQKKKTSSRKAAKKEDDAEEDAEKTAESVEKPTKGRKQAAAKPAATALKNKTSTSYDDINFDDCTRKNAKGEEWNFKISNWNVDGIRAWLVKGGLKYIQYEKPDIFCLQETKCSKEKLPAEVTGSVVEDYKVYWACSEKDGYAGVALYTKNEPISVQYGLGDDDHDEEGRIITAEYDHFYVISVYVPNSGRGLVTLTKRLKWNESFRSFVNGLNQKKPVIVCGDMNVSHLEIDLTNPKTNTKNAGFTKEERDGMTEFLSDGYVDTFRKVYPDKTQAYTFWTYMSSCRAKNVGWRLDYFIVSEVLMDTVCDNIIRSEVFGSDHCPITLFLKV